MKTSTKYIAKDHRFIGALLTVSTFILLLFTV